jgi:hypothetical protein
VNLLLSSLMALNQSAIRKTTHGHPLALLVEWDPHWQEKKTKGTKLRKSKMENLPKENP